MGIWDNLPYEMQSPRWRSGLNKAEGSKEWDPTLNESWATRFLDAQTDLANAAANGVNTTQVDGQTGFINSLAGFGSALLQSIGGRPDAGSQPVAQPVAWGRSEPKGLDTSTLAILAVLGVGVYVAFGK